MCASDWQPGVPTLANIALFYHIFISSIFHVIVIEPDSKECTFIIDVSMRVIGWLGNSLIIVVNLLCSLYSTLCSCWVHILCSSHSVHYINLLIYVLQWVWILWAVFITELCVVHHVTLCTYLLITINTVTICINVNMYNLSLVSRQQFYLYLCFRIDAYVFKCYFPYVLFCIHLLISTCRRSIWRWEGRTQEENRRSE